MSTHDPRDDRRGDDRIEYITYDDDTLEEEITRGTVHDRNYEENLARDRTDADHPGTRRESARETEPDGIRTGTLVWGVIALLVALWSLSATVLDWRVDPILVMIGLATLGGVALIAGGIAGAARRRTH